MKERTGRYPSLFPETNRKLVIAAGALLCAACVALLIQMLVWDGQFDSYVHYYLWHITGVLGFGMMAAGVFAENRKLLIVGLAVYMFHVFLGGTWEFFAYSPFASVGFVPPLIILILLRFPSARTRFPQIWSISAALAALVPLCTVLREEALTAMSLGLSHIEAIHESLFIIFSIYWDNALIWLLCSVGLVILAIALTKKVAAGRSGE